MTTSVYTTATNVAEELRASVLFSSTTNPTLTTVERWIEEASEEIDDIQGWVAMATTQTEYIDYTNQEFINMEKFPIISVTSLAENTNSLGSDSGESWVEKTEGTHFSVYNDKGQILVNFLKWNPTAGYRKLKLIYTSGFSTIPPVLRMLSTKMAAQRVLDSLIQNNVQAGNTGGSVSVGSINIVEPADYGIRSYSQLGRDIEGLKTELIKNTGVYRYTC